MPKFGKGRGKGKGTSGNGSKGKGGKGMHVDGDTAYLGEYGYDYYNHDTFYTQFAGELGMLTNFSPELVKIVRAKDIPKLPGPEFEIPKNLSKLNTGISRALHEAMKYKPTLTRNKFVVLEGIPELDDEYDRNMNLSSAKQTMQQEPKQ